MPTDGTGDLKTGVTETLTKAPVEPGGVCLRVLAGPDVGRSFELPEGSAIVGKSSRCDLVLTDSAVSAQHLRVEVTDAGLKVRDLGSTNGTTYLQTHLQEAVLVHGAVISLGRSRLALSSRQPPAGPEHSARQSYGRLVGSAPAMRRMYAVLERLEGNDHKVLILGETGVGKELVAREIHDNSAVRDGPYVVFDCGAVPERLIESELFGHVRGAFTGANRDHAGVFARAHGGTLFLDEIGELPLGLQPTLLRALETGEVRPVGGAAYQPARPRVVAATNRDLAAEVAAGRFREDLYYRLNVVAVFVPPLRDRREDIPALVGHFLATSGQPDVELPPETLEMLTTGYDWPGNIRELLNVMSRVLVLGNLPEQIREAHESSGPGPETVDPGEELAPFPEAKRRVMAAFERDYLKAQVDRAGGNLSEAARQSGLDRSYFKRLLKRHGLGRADQG